ncbi:MAG: hypothetical protein M3417_04385 [Actinomycetota bacterium]|nr:hypothetical protein [Actinomycetota bacterium]
MIRAISVLFLAAPLALAVGSTAQAQRTSGTASDRPWSTDGGEVMRAPWPGSTAARSSLSSPGHARQDGGLAHHLPPVRENMQVVGKLELTQPFGNVLPGQIADVAVFKNAAYVMSWSPKDKPGDTACKRGGFFSVDISNPAAPVQKAFVPALGATYHGEGAHATTINTPQFNGDILAVNNEPCGPQGVGGFDLYDVSDPAKPVALVLGAGDRSPDGSLVQDLDEVPHSNHSIFIWQDGPRAYAVTVDNTELHDVDIFDITNPSSPRMIAEHDFVELFPNIVQNSAYGNGLFQHDMVVKRIDGRMTLLSSYWDAGYVQVDVSDPRRPQYITDTDFPDVDPLVKLTPAGAPEGNAHQAEYSSDNRFILAADEDFATSRVIFEITDGPKAGPSPAGEFDFGLPIRSLPDGKLNGPTVYGGYGCSARDEIPPAATAFAGTTFAPGEEKIVVLQRGPFDDPGHTEPACRFDEKMQNAIDKGYDGILIGHPHVGDEASDGAFCGPGNPRAIPGLCVTHRAMHDIFDDPPSFAVPYPPGHGPEPGRLGARVSGTRPFDGWGYAHLYDAKTSALIDDYAIPEGIDARFASGFGDLSIHEFATDPETNLAYSAYYAGGLRVLRFSRAGGLQETGKFIDEGGSNFWGVEHHTDKDGNRLIVGSDRDYGLYVVKYTGPGAVLAKPPAPAAPRPTPPVTPPVATPPVAAPPVGVPAKVVLSSSFGFGPLSRVTVRRRRTGVTITVPGAGKATGTLKIRKGSRMIALGTATRTAKAAGKLRLSFRLSSAAEASLRRVVAARRTRRTSGVVRVSFTRKGGVQRTRNRSVSIAMR